MQGANDVSVPNSRFAEVVALVCVSLLIFTCKASSQDPPSHVGDSRSILDSLRALSAKRSFCYLEHVSSFPYVDTESGEQKVLGFWYMVDCERERGDVSSGRPHVEGNLLTGGTLLSDGPAHRPLARILSFSFGPTASPGKSPKAFVIMDGKIFQFWYAPQSCRTGILGAMVTSLSLDEPGIPFGEALREAPSREGASVLFPLQRVLVDKECGLKRLVTDVDGHSVFLTLERWDGSASLARFEFVPEEPDGCAKWYRVDLTRTRLRYTRPLGAPDEEWEYIREMEEKCQDF